MNFYMCLIILTELLMIAMSFHVFHYSGFTKVQKAWYLLTFISVIFCAASEFLVHCGYYDKAFAIPLTVITVLQFSIAPLLGVTFSGALGLRRPAIVAGTLCTLNLLFQIIAAPFGWVFSFTDAGYSRGPAFIEYEIFYLISLSYLIVSLFIVGKRFKHRDVWTIAMVLIVLIVGILPMMIYKLNVTYIAIAISGSLCYIYYNDLVQQDTQAAYAANQEKIRKMQENMISGLANLVENRDVETGEHIARTSFYVKTLAECCKKDGVYTDIIDDHYVDLLVTLAPMHDIGKILVSDRILTKPGKLTPEEYEEIKKHAAQGGAVVREVLRDVTDEEFLSFASDIATYHHERWDGSGYSAGLKGEEIPLCARIMAIADVFDALISKRCYKEAIPVDEAIEIIREKSGTHFDPKLVEVFLKHQEEFILPTDNQKEE